MKELGTKTNRGAGSILILFLLKAAGIVITSLFATVVEEGISLISTVDTSICYRDWETAYYRDWETAYYRDWETAYYRDWETAY